jgi:hypothetical protein
MAGHYIIVAAQGTTSCSGKNEVELLQGMKRKTIVTRWNITYSKTKKLEKHGSYTRVDVTTPRQIVLINSSNSYISSAAVQGGGRTKMPHRRS